MCDRPNKERGPRVIPTHQAQRRNATRPRRERRVVVVIVVFVVEIIIPQLLYMFRHFCPTHYEACAFFHESLI